MRNHNLMGHYPDGKYLLSPGRCFGFMYTVTSLQAKFMYTDTGCATFTHVHVHSVLTHTCSHNHTTYLAVHIANF